MTKKDTTEPKKGSGSDNEKSPVNATAAKDDGAQMEEVGSGKPEEPKPEPSTENGTKPMQDVTKPAEETSKQAEDVPKPTEEIAKPVDGPL